MIALNGNHSTINIEITSKTDFYKSAQVGGFSPEVEDGERRARDDINLRLSHPAPTIWEDREIETGLRSVGLSLAGEDYHAGL